MINKSLYSNDIIKQKTNKQTLCPRIHKRCHKATGICEIIIVFILDFMHIVVNNINGILFSNEYFYVHLIILGIVTFFVSFQMGSVRI